MPDRVFFSKVSDFLNGTYVNVGMYPHIEKAEGIGRGLCTANDFDLPVLTLGLQGTRSQAKPSQATFYYVIGPATAKKLQFW